MNISDIKNKIALKQLDVFTDSRKAFTDLGCFVALVGERFDAIDFVPELMAKGLKLAIVTDNEPNRQKMNSFKEKVFFVTDTTQFIQDVSTQKLDQWRKDTNKKVIALTGSNGKTTTKEMIRHLLAGLPLRSHATKGNLNNHLGVPFTILEMPLETDVLLLEMGTNHPGEIQRLAELAPVDAGLITNIGQSHLEFFHNEDNVFVEKSSLYHSVCKQKGNFIINMEDIRLRQLVGHPFTYTFGLDANYDYVFQILREEAILKHGENVLRIPRSLVPEKHNLMNMGLAISLLLSLWPNQLENLQTQILSYKAPRNNRSMFLKHADMTVYMDAYNANPSSMQTSVNGFVEWLNDHHFSLKDAWFILADMNELGEHAPRYHQDIGQILKKLKIQNVSFIGRYAQDYIKGFGAGESFKDRHEFLQKYGKAPSSRAWKSKFIFLKGSRTLQLEELIDITEFQDF